jgi:glycosyltransferase involved in cell wall biosynthesis
MGRPVIVPNTQGIRDYFGDDSALFFEPGDPHSLAAVIERVSRNPQNVAAVIAKARNIYDQHRWEIQRRHFLEMVSSLLFSGRY